MDGIKRDGINISNGNGKGVFRDFGGMHDSLSDMTAGSKKAFYL